MLEPAPDAVVSGPVRVRVQGHQAEYSADGSDWRRLDDLTWDTSTVDDGRYLIRAAANGTASDPITVVVDNGAPQVSLVAPPAGEVVREGTVLRAEAADAGSGIVKVEFMLSDGSPTWQAVGAAEPPNLEARWDARGLQPGTYWLCAIATDYAGNAAASEPVHVAVKR